MPYYYVLITYVSKLTQKLVTAGFYDLSEERLRKAIVQPYLNGQQFFLGGRCIDPHLIETIKIYETEEKVKLLSEKESCDVDIILEEIIDGERGKFVTDFFITVPPTTASKNKTERKLTKKVFLVHGRDLKPMEELKNILKEFGLIPIVLHEQPSGSRTIVEKLEKHSDVGYAFVILSPDDIGVSFQDLFEKTAKTSYEDKALDSARRILEQTQGNIERFIEFNEKFIHDRGDASDFLRFLAPRARQNVVLEFGYFIGLLGRDRVAVSTKEMSSCLLICME